MGKLQEKHRKGVVAVRITYCVTVRGSVTEP